MLVNRKYECFVMWMLYFCASCTVWFVNAGRACKRQPYGRGILQNRSHDCLVGSHECLLLFAPCCFGACFYCLWKCRYLCTERL